MTKRDQYGVPIRWCRFQFDTDFERWYVELADRDDPNADEYEFYALVPADIAKAYHDAGQTYQNTLVSLVHLAGLAQDEPAHKTACNRFEDRLTQDEQQHLHRFNMSGWQRCVRCGCHENQHPDNRKTNQ